MPNNSRDILIVIVELTAPNFQTFPESLDAYMYIDFLLDETDKRKWVRQRHRNKEYHSCEYAVRLFFSLQTHQIPFGAANTKNKRKGNAQQLLHISKPEFELLFMKLCRTH